MAQPVEHDGTSGAATVVGSAAKGAFWGLGAVSLVGAVVVGLLAAAIAAVTMGGAIGVMSVLAIGAVAAGTVATAPYWLPVMGLGAVLGGISGVSKVGSEQRAFEQQIESSGRGADVQAALQQARMQGMQAGYQQGVQVGYQGGQNQVLERLQQVHAELSKLDDVQQKTAPAAPVQEIAKQDSAPAMQPHPESEQANVIRHEHHHMVEHAPVHETVEMAAASGEVDEKGGSVGRFAAMVANSRRGSVGIKPENIAAQRRESMLGEQQAVGA